MVHDVKVAFYLKRNEAKEDGRCPVMARLSVGKYSDVVFSMKMNVPMSLWVLGRVSGKSLMAKDANRQLDEIRASALSIYQDLSAVREQITAEEVKNVLLGMASGQATLLSYFRAYNANFNKRVGVNREAISAFSYQYALGHVANFIKATYKLSDIPFTALNRSFIDKYDLYLRVERKVASGTIVLLTTRLRTIVGQALAEGILTADPFAGYEPQRPQREQKYLTREELNRLMITPLRCPKHYLIRDLFLFSCYTGISYSDMCRLTEHDLEKVADGTVWIKTTRKKTGTRFEVPLLELPQQILERYRDVAPDGKLLPMFGDRAMNEHLKYIARTCGINRRLTFHMARHTYATEITLSQGVPIETVSRMLGHSRISTTQIYAKITDDKIGSDMQALDRRLAGKFTFAI